jgi:hypothetical protein
VIVASAQAAAVYEELRTAIELVLGHFEVTVAIDLIALGDVLGRDLLAGISIHLQISDAIAGFLIDLIETDFFGFGCRRIKSYRTGHQR